MPSIPEGVEIEMNGAEIDVTSAAGSGMQIVGGGATGTFALGSALMTNGLTGRAHDTIHGGRIVYAGPVGQSTGIGLRISDALSADITGVTVIGFRTCFQIEAVEYSHFDFDQAASGGTGFKVTTGWTTVGGPSMPNGGISIDNQFFGDIARMNKINYWLNGAAANRFYEGTSSVATVANYVLGGNPPNYVSTIALSNTVNATCTPNANIPLTFADVSGSGADAEGILVTNGSGTPTAAWSINGGTNYSLTAGAVTASVPNNLTLGSFDCGHGRLRWSRARQHRRELFQPDGRRE